jgi:hypothetical protein
MVMISFSKVVLPEGALGEKELETKPPGGAMVGGDPMTLMVRHTAFAAYAPEYVKRLVEEVERLRKELGR